MSLAYELDVSKLPYDKFSSALVNLATNGITELAEFIGEFRLISPTRPTVTDIYPTGEYIIRKGMYVNGLFCYVGSYKAYCLDLFGTNNHGYAWDGFILFTRGYNITADTPNTSPIVTTPTAPNNEFNSGIGFIPMRMMFEVNPGPIGDATAISNDSTVGLYGIDYYKDEADFGVNALSSGDISLIVCGTQRIDSTVEGVPTGQNYIGNLYMGRFLRQTGIGNIGDDVRVASYEAPRFTDTTFGVMQITWKANQANHKDKTFEAGRFRRYVDLNEKLGCVEALAFDGGGGSPGLIWNYQEWFDGFSPDTQHQAVQNYIYPRRFLDISCVSQVPYTTNAQAGSVFIIAGDVGLDTDGDGDIDKTVPCIVSCAYPYTIFGNDAGYTFPYMSINCADATVRSRDATYSWGVETTTPQYNFDGAVAVFCSLPYEALDLSIPYDVFNFPVTVIAVDNINYNGTNYGGMWGFNDTPLYEGQELIPIASEGGSFTTATTIELPTKWYGKAIQQRTFTISEEDVAKQGTTDTETGDFTPTANSIYDFDAAEYIGYISNFQRYGAFKDLETANIAPTAQPGEVTGSGYGYLGIRNTVGPIAVMFDSGSPNFLDTPIRNTIVARAEGANLNSNTLSNPTSTTRKVVNCGWDNDRDQWLFISSDTNDVSVLSVSSNFSTASNDVGFLDQTDNFKGLTTNTNSAMYFPISMSNSLDGWVWFGDLDENSVGSGIKPTSLGSATTQTITYPAPISLTVTWDAYLDATTDIYRISGTTGRTARVWIDYVLFDGVDSVIAKKLREYGIKVNIDNVEWFKRKIIRSGDLNIKAEEIEEWMRSQQTQYNEMLKEKERMGRIRKRKSQVSAYSEGMEEQINPDFMDTEVKDHLEEFIPKSRPPTEKEMKIDKKRKGGYEPETKSYYDDVFDDTE